MPQNFYFSATFNVFTDGTERRDRTTENGTERWDITSGPERLRQNVSGPFWFVQLFFPTRRPILSRRFAVWKRRNILLSERHRLDLFMQIIKSVFFLSVFNYLYFVKRRPIISYLLPLYHRIAYKK